MVFRGPCVDKSLSAASSASRALRGTACHAAARSRCATDTGIGPVRGSARRAASSNHCLEDQQSDQSIPDIHDDLHGYVATKSRMRRLKWRERRPLSWPASPASGE